MTKEDFILSERFQSMSREAILKGIWCSECGAIAVQCLPPCDVPLHLLRAKDLLVLCEQCFLDYRGAMNE